MTSKSKTRWNHEPPAPFGLRMDIPASPPPAGFDPVATLLGRIARLVPVMRERAAALDRDARFPAEDVDDLRAADCLTAPLSVGQGGLGLGTEPAGATGIMELLRRLGQGNLSVGRLFEAHVNALRLISAYGTETQQRWAAAETRRGHLFALWVAEVREGLRIAGPQEAPRLRGAKSFCSAAGAATRAVVTATGADGVQMVLVEVGAGIRAEQLPHPPQGMRAAATGRMAFDDVTVGPGALLGDPGDYLREPEFSAGAWRTSAVTLGGLEALVNEARTQLAARGRDADPHQR
ncbi:MAG: acyl-CoA/acyl-ACP dehydrogenase, partial [Pseudomonadota bacterium]|nr:acyl-CoA/acyl-ACP dehydrogenase [Pseudomonadota bacterium]